MSMEIHPNQGIGPIRFGMTSDEVRKALGKPYTSFMKTPDDEIPTDGFDSEGIYVYYKKPGICEAVEVAAPCEPELDGQTLQGRPFNEVRRWLEQLDPDVVVDEDGFTSYTLGVSGYCPIHPEDPTAPIEGIMVFEKGYYDDL